MFMCSRTTGLSTLACGFEEGNLLTSASRHHLHPTRINQAFAAIAILVDDLALQHVGHGLLAAMGVVPEAGCHPVGFDVV